MAWIKNVVGKIVTERKALSGLSVQDEALITRIRSRKLTYLSESKLRCLTESCRLVEETNLSGIFLEAGCALGGSSILIASVKKDERPLYIFDVFEMIPPPTNDDPREVHDRYKVIKEGKSKGIGRNKYYGYQKDLYGIVQSNFVQFGIDREKQHVVLIKGLVQDKLLIDQPVAFAHIDVDWYEPVKTCLERIVPKLATGGIVVLDDYYDWGGCKIATDEYFANLSGQFDMDDSAGSLKITKLHG